MWLTWHSGQVAFCQEPKQVLVVPPHKLTIFWPKPMAPWTAGYYQWQQLAIIIISHFLLNCIFSVSLILMCITLFYNSFYYYKFAILEFNWYYCYKISKFKDGSECNRLWYYSIISSLTLKQSVQLKNHLKNITNLLKYSATLYCCNTKPTATLNF